MAVVARERGAARRVPDGVARQVREKTRGRARDPGRRVVRDPVRPTRWDVTAPATCAQTRAERGAHPSQVEKLIGRDELPGGAEHTDRARRARGVHRAKSQGTDGTSKPAPPRSGDRPHRQGRVMIRCRPAALRALHREEGDVAAAQAVDEAVARQAVQDHVCAGHALHRPARWGGAGSGFFRVREVSVGQLRTLDRAHARSMPIQCVPVRSICSMRGTQVWLRTTARCSWNAG